MAGLVPAMTLKRCASRLSCPRIAVQRTACFARLCRGHPRLCSLAREEDVDGRNKSGHDVETLCLSTVMPATSAGMTKKNRRP